MACAMRRPVVVESLNVIGRGVEKRPLPPGPACVATITMALVKRIDDLIQGVRCRASWPRRTRRTRHYYPRPGGTPTYRRALGGFAVGIVAPEQVLGPPSEPEKP